VGRRTSVHRQHGVGMCRLTIGLHGTVNRNIRTECLWVGSTSGVGWRIGGFIRRQDGRVRREVGNCQPSIGERGQGIRLVWLAFGIVSRTVGFWIFLSGFQPDLPAIQPERLIKDFFLQPYHVSFPSTDNFIRFLWNQFPLRKKKRRSLSRHPAEPPLNLPPHSGRFRGAF